MGDVDPKPRVSEATRNLQMQPGLAVATTVAPVASM